MDQDTKGHAASDEKDSRSYELSFLVRQEADAHELLAPIKRLKGEVTMEGPVGKIALAYPIKKQTSAYFGFVHFSMVPGTVPALEKELTTNSLVVRFLVITPPFVKGAERPLPRSREKGTPMRPKAERKQEELLSNEALEKKLEEILQ